VVVSSSSLEVDDEAVEVSSFTPLSSLSLAWLVGIVPEDLGDEEEVMVALLVGLVDARVLLVPIVSVVDDVLTGV
jgi:hypothetical protein